jgi:hypothetical protein
MGQSCTYNGTSYSDGAVVCQAGYEYACNDGNWDALNTPCAQADGVQTRRAGRGTSPPSSAQGKPAERE